MLPSSGIALGNECLQSDDVSKPAASPSYLEAYEIPRKDVQRQCIQASEVRLHKVEVVLRYLTTAVTGVSPSAIGAILQVCMGSRAHT